jgi:hypothetical protein
MPHKRDWDGRPDVFCDQYRHARIVRQNFWQHAFPLGSEVGDDDKGHAGFGRHGLNNCPS